MMLCIDSCFGNSVYCSANKLCLPYDWICNHRNDCPSGKDEVGCGELRWRYTKNTHMFSNNFMNIRIMFYLTSLKYYM